MLDVTAESYVFDYANNAIRCGSASRISGSTDRDLYRTCSWTFYRFLLELFRSPAGDPRLTRGKLESTLAVKLEEARLQTLEVSAEGEFTQHVAT
jgi:hypothetical protein